MLGIGGTAQYPQLFLPNLNFTKEGKYTLVYDYYVPSDLTLWFLQTGLSTTRRLAYMNGSLQTVTETLVIEPGSGITIPNIFIQAGKDTSVNKYYYIDNLRLYYLAETAPDPEYGILIDKNDFESANSLDASLGITGSGMYHFGTGASFSVGIPAEVTGADNMLKVTTTTQTAASAGYANMEITRAGTYTFVFDCFVSKDYPLGWFKVKNNIEDVTIALKKGVKETYTAQIKLEEGQTLTQIFFQSYNYGSAINGSFYIDNIKLYLEPESYHFSDYATNLVTTFTGDAKTQRGFAWTADITCDEMVIRYSEKGENSAENYTEVAGKYEAYEGKFYYKAELTGLKPGTEYVYTIGSVQKNAWSDELVFETEPEEISSYKVLAFADPQVDNTSVAAVWTSNAEKAFSDVPDAKFSLGLGDLVNLGTDEKQWQMYFDSFGGACETIPNMSILGNHEARAGIAGKNFRLHFNNPDNGHSALGGLTKNDFAETYTKELVDNFAESVYSFDYGNAHFVALNTGSDWAASTDGIKLVKAQLAWLENDLYNSNAKWNIVMVHRPVYDCYDPESEGSLATVLDSVLSEYGVDLVLQGHEHYIARTYPIKNKEAVITEDANAVEKGTGVVYFTAGRASNLSVSSPKNIPDYIANFANTAGGNPTYTVLEVGEDKLSVVTKTLNGEIADSFEIISDGESDTPVKPVREMLVYEDFEDVADGTVIFNSTDCGTLTTYKNSYVNATNPGTASIYKDKLFCITRGGELNTSYVTTLNGNRLVRVDQRTDGVSTYPQIGLYGGNTNANSPFGITAGGVYTLKDVADIAKAGFNHIRTAALGERHWDGDTYVAETSFPDAMTKEADKNGLAVFMRLNGYTMNQRGWEDAKPIDQFGNASAGVFIHDTLNHPELIKDTDNASAQLAIHFAEFPNIIGFQLFNEPTIQAWNNNPPSFFDYNPYAMAEFKKWLVRKGYYSEEGAYAVEVPKEYPIPADKKNIFRLFRQFGVENTSAMLCRLNGAVRKATPHLPCFTNCIAVPFTTYVSGCEGDCFEIGDMDIIGFDLYEEVRGFEYFHSMRLLDMCENAAFVNGKKAWLPEMCCRTHMRIDDYERECYAAIGAGYKGVTYYLWRADLGGPEVQLGGMLWNNRDKTEKFEDAVKFNEMINKEGESIVTSEVVRDGVAILYSVHGAAMGEGSDEDGQNRWYRLTNDRYAELVEMGVAPVFITADKLASAPFDIKLLFVPTLAPLDAKEKTLVEEFAKTHAVVAYDNRFIAACGDKVCGTNTVSNWCHKPAGTWQAELFNHRERFRTAELLEITGVKPLFKVSSTANTLALRTLKNDNAEKPFYLLSLVHTRADGNVTTDGVICFDEAETGKITVVRYVDRNGECVLEIERRDGRAFVKVPYSENIGGAFMYLYR